MRQDLICANEEALWLKVQSSYIKLLSVRSCYRQLLSDWTVCDMMNSICATGNEMYLTDDLDINCCRTVHWRVKFWSHLTQVINQAKKNLYKQVWHELTSTCINAIFTNDVDMCLKAISVPTGRSGHNIMAINDRSGGIANVDYSGSD